jgi:hypothetical protein
MVNSLCVILPSRVANSKVYVAAQIVPIGERFDSVIPIIDVTVELLAMRWFQLQTVAKNYRRL